MLNGKTISVVLPARNEALVLPSLIPKLRPLADEIIIVDNCSTDDTAAIATNLGCLVVTETRQDRQRIGYGFAHRRGIRLATGDYIVSMDADGTYPIEQIPGAINYLERKRLDFVSCARFPLRREHAISSVRQFGVALLNLEVLLLYWYPIKDILSGMWVVRRPVAQAMDFSQGGWNFSPEVKLEALTNPFIRFGEWHIDHKTRKGESKQQLFLTGLNHALYIFWRRLTVDNPLLLLFTNLVDYLALGIFIVRQRRWPTWLGRDKKSNCLDSCPTCDQTQEKK